MAKTFEITTSRHWKALSHPLRLGILSELRAGDRTNEELAMALGVESGKLYFHTKQLLTAGLIEPAGTRQKGPITEKLYRLTAERFHAPPPSLDGDRPPFGDMLTSALGLYESTWLQDRHAMDRLHGGYHIAVALPPEDIRRLIDRIKQMVDEAMAANSENADAVPMALTVLLHGLPEAGTKESRE